MTKTKKLPDFGEPPPEDLPPGVLRPGGLRDGPEDVEEEKGPPEPAPTERYAFATYHGQTEDEIAETHAEESLCPGCYHAPVCRFAPADDAPAVVISRCLAFSPLPE